jgi:hypothetical protein
MDCVGTNAYLYQSWVGDEYCDDGAYGINFLCIGWQCDAGDCGEDVTAMCESGIASEAGCSANICNACSPPNCDGPMVDDLRNWDCLGNMVSTDQQAWIGDGYCDDGAYGLNFLCEAFQCDGGDCSDEINAGCESGNYNEAACALGVCGACQPGTEGACATGPIHNPDDHPSVDCVGTDASAYITWMGDGWCDDGHYGMNFLCAEWQCDAGDCGDSVTEMCNAGTQSEEGCTAGICGACTPATCDGPIYGGSGGINPDIEPMPDCVGTDAYWVQSWKGDGFCDDGAYGINYLCPEWECDAGDCGPDITGWCTSGTVSEEACLHGICSACSPAQCDGPMDNLWHLECGVPGDDNSCAVDYSAYGTGCCDSALADYGLTCDILESEYGWDCTGCSCTAPPTVETPPPSGTSGTTGTDDVENTSTGGNDGAGPGAAGDSACTQFDCTGYCMDGYEDWIGDGWCDDGTYGVNFLCPEFGCDNSDCGNTLTEACNNPTPSEFFCNSHNLCGACEPSICYYGAEGTSGQMTPGPRQPNTNTGGNAGGMIVNGTSAAPLYEVEFEGEEQGNSSEGGNATDGQSDAVSMKTFSMHLLSVMCILMLLV